MQRALRLKGVFDDVYKKIVKSVKRDDYTFKSSAQDAGSLALIAAIGPRPSIQAPQRLLAA
jgi:hypothetical protein